MLDIGKIRKDPQCFIENMKKRGADIDINGIIFLDEQRREVMTKTQNLHAKQNELASKIGKIKCGKETGNVEELMQESEKNKGEIHLLDELDKNLQKKLHDVLATVPNILQDCVPFGGEEDALEITKQGEKPNFDFTPVEHYVIGEKSGDMNFEEAVKMAGSRFVILKSQLARLERALKNFMLDCHTKEFGYTECSVPHLVNENAMFGTGQLPKFDNGYQTTDGFYLIPTSEVPLTNIVNGQIVSNEKLPMRFCAYSQCFRSEAGASGKDTAGMLRQHQFSKVELVSICMPDESNNEHERMLSAAENILKKLGLHYRVCILASQDTGFCSSKTYDIEVWLPGQGKYREISSCSNTLDFQARRMMARYKDLSGNKGYVHTLNGSGLAIGRTIIAIMENFQTSDKSFTIPEVLVEYMR